MSASVAAVAASFATAVAAAALTHEPAICGPRATRPPCGPGVKIGIAYRYALYTHCGIRYAWFDGRLWRAAPPLSKRGWREPSQVGTMRLRSRTRADFRASPRRLARFRPAPPLFRPKACD